MRVEVELPEVGENNGDEATVSFWYRKNKRNFQLPLNYHSLQCLFIIFIKY